MDEIILRGEAARRRRRQRTLRTNARDAILGMAATLLCLGLLLFVADVLARAAKWYWGAP